MCGVPMSFTDPDSRTAPPLAREFVTTHWSVVLLAGKTEGAEADQALEYLCRAYWYPLYAYVRRQGHSAHDAQDLTQDFFARLLERKYLRFEKLPQPSRLKFSRQSLWSSQRRFKSLRPQMRLPSKRRA